ncbi:MAG: hypothetical protein CVU39_22550 [Chloroflexi bacterium HGW-Chloroflexi-10]|nr:MAG: hypothetical protein CVU39_22550 [Chloroflexi bacterium HGW-Chloroflexi-10]
MFTKQITRMLAPVLHVLFFSRTTKEATKKRSLLLLAVLPVFLFLPLLFSFSSGAAQTSEWTPAWVDLSDSGVIHSPGLDADAAAKPKSPVPNAFSDSEKSQLPATNSQFFSPQNQLINTNSSATAGWETIFSDDFEGSFPGEWNVFDNDSTTNGEYFWAKKNCRVYAGSNSAWVVGGGADGSALACNSEYPGNAASWMIYGPFSLADATDAEFSFMYWLNSESSFDILFAAASINGINFYGGYNSGIYDWTERIFDLTDVHTLGDLTGQSQVWVMVAFQSDESVQYPEGAYIDNFELRKYVGAEPTPSPEITPTLSVDDASVYLPLLVKQLYTGPTATPTVTPVPSITPTPTATSVGVVPNNGNWSGSTSQGRAISFSVGSNGTAVNDITISVGWGGACGGVSSTTYYLYDAVINAGSFSKSQSGGTEVEGTFTSANNASGDFYAVLVTYYPSYCRATTSGTWSANYVP